MALVSFTGLSSGIDTRTLVDQLVKIERQPIDALQQKQKDLGGISSRLSKLSGLLTDLKSEAEKLGSRTSLLSTKGVSSDATAVSVSATGDASPGSYSLEVSSLAKAERTYSDGFTSATQAGLFGTGSITLQIGSGSPVSIDVDAADTLESVAQKINATGVELGASVLFDGTSYRLRVSGNDTGAANNITFTETGTTLGLSKAANEVQKATDAVFKIDGFSISRPDNTITDVIEGVSFTLSKVTTEPVTIGVERDDEALTENVRAFVDAYNAISKSLDSEFSYTGAAKLGNTLAGDSTLRGLQSRLRAAVGHVFSGAPTAYNRFSALGISTKQDGTLELDEDALSKAVDADPEAVASLLTGDESATGGFMARFTGLVEDYTKSGTGILSLKKTGIDARARSMDGQIERMERRISSYEDRLRAQFTAMEQMISNIQSQGSQITSILDQLG